MLFYPGLANANTGSSEPSVQANHLPLSVTAVKFRKMHGALGPFDLPIDRFATFAGAVSIEPRVGATEHNLVFLFSETVNSVGLVSAVDSQGNSYGVERRIVNSEVTVTVTGVPDNKRVKVTVNGVNGTLDQSISIGFLVGDINRLRAVNATDIVSVKALAGAITDQNNFIFDLNTDGVIDAADVTEVKARSGLVLVSTFTGGAPVAPMISGGAPPVTGEVNVPFSHTFTAAGTAPIVWSVIIGTLPEGLTLNANTGELSGTPLVAGTYGFALLASNGTPPEAVVPAGGTLTMVIYDGSFQWSGNSIEGYRIPLPSKVAKTPPPVHPGLNGAGFNVNAWAVSPSRCNNTQPPISTLWHHNIDFADHGAKQNLDYFDMARNEALTYQFVAGTTGVGSISIGDSSQVPLVATFISLSSSPCDFDVSKLTGSSKSYCYSSQPLENSLAYEVTNGPVTFVLNCKLIPGNTYYLNLRFQDGTPSGANTTDSCAANGSGRCGGWVQIRR